ncbi:hypothetical protein CLF_112962, partial [Clonorchis sinensis]
MRNRRTFSRITRMDFQILYGAYVIPLLEYANPVVYSGRTKGVILIERVQRAATKMVAGLKSMDYETRLAVLDLFPLEYRRLRGDLILTYALFEQGLTNRFFTRSVSFGLEHLLSWPRHIMHPREFVPCSSQDKWTLSRPPHTHITSTSNCKYRKLGEISHPQIPKPAHNLKTPLPNLSPYQAMPPGHLHATYLRSLCVGYLHRYLPRLLRSRAQLHLYNLQKAHQAIHT